MIEHPAADASAVITIGTSDETCSGVRIQFSFTCQSSPTSGIKAMKGSGSSSSTLTSFATFQSIDGQLRWASYSNAFAAAIPAGLALLLIPMMGIRRSVRRAKREELARLDRAIAAADRDLGPDPLGYLGDLLGRRETVADAREWPLDTTAFSRIAIYFIIPPIAWVGGAIAEIAIQAGLDSG